MGPPPEPLPSSPDTAAKAAPQPKAKVLSIGIPAAPPKEETKDDDKRASSVAAETGPKTVAAKAVKPNAKEVGSGKASPTPTSGRSSPSRGVKEGERTFDVDAVEKAQSTDVDDETLQELYGKEHVNIVRLDIWTSGRNLSTSSPLTIYLHPPSNSSPLPLLTPPHPIRLFLPPTSPFSSRRSSPSLPAIFSGLYADAAPQKIFMGHVDAGKSTLGGAILYATGMVDQRTLDKYKREAKEMGRETWYLSWALDLTNEERSKGKTVEVGRGYFETEKRRYSILDAPGHKNYVPNMIGGASQADVGILVISARKGEYETGFERGGQTRERE